MKRNKYPRFPLATIKADPLLQEQLCDSLCAVRYKDKFFVNGVEADTTFIERASEYYLSVLLTTLSDAMDYIIYVKRLGVSL